MATRKLNTIEDLSESWVELNSGGGLAAENEYIRLLREAQRESRDSSVRHSRASSVKGSPKSPPNSPNLEPSTEDELRGVYINCWRDESNDWVWEWSSRPDQMPPKDWRFKHPVSARGPPSATSSIEVLEQQLCPPTSQQSINIAQKIKRRSCLFSRGALAAVLVTNLVSLLLGAGIGVWLSKRGMLPPRLIVLN
ncbi:BCL2/adenovirus E1B 19 kDa protein-interacting protein 3 [Leguminivora glycinivorella]|uniref:BCL2/adenovirus E1B 19 kDa protein-interacting protein 3 n=1 Tax=Leguminivora glycinivorella TaxID=1035111 RepID=UPI00200D4781|nr:BCL2/adenovirus E1B 19 kDa protein-interacting protein 3 [Leguminivora glycinivorella]